MTGELASKDESSNIDTSQVHGTRNSTWARLSALHAARDYNMRYVIIGSIVQVEDALIIYGRDCQMRITQEVMKDLQSTFLYFFCCPEDESKPNWLKNSRIDVCGVILGAAQAVLLRSFHFATDAAGTVRDYMDDFQSILHVSAFRKVVEQVHLFC
jgi:hypothetical protein